MRSRRIRYPFTINENDKVRVSVGAYGTTANLNIVYAAYEFEGKKYVGSTGYQMMHPRCRVNDEVMVYPDPDKPERFYVK